MTSSTPQPGPGRLPLGPVILNVEGTQLLESDRTILRHPLVGGLIFFARNFESRDQLSALVAEIREIRPNLLLSVDQEGGRVRRFTKDFTQLPPMQRFWQSCHGDVDSVLSLVRDCGWLLASEILACDIDISFAPVLDVDDNQCQVISDRAFAPDPEAASRLAGAFIDGMHAAGMACTGKHFPGHGGVVEDSHDHLPIDKRDYEQLRQRDLIPFLQLMDRLDALMPAHLLVPAVDSQAVGFSSKWLRQILRRELGFKGVIFSDDLSMGGAASAGNYGDRAERALEAGCDAVLVCNNRAGAEEVLERLEQRHLQADDRLAAMSRRKSPTWSELRNSLRWRETQTRLASLVQSASS